MITDEQMNEFINTVASNVGGSFPSYIDASDIASTLWIWYLDNKHTVDNLIVNNESWEPMLYGTMVRVANTYALEEEAQANGYSTEDAYYYSVPVIRELLKDAFNHEDWQSFSTFGDGQPKSKRVGPTSDRVEMLIDVKRAVENLESEDQYNVILWHYKYGFGYEWIGHTLQCTEGAARKRLERAVGAVQRALGKKPLTDMRNDSGSRTNAQALAYQESIY